MIALLIADTALMVAALIVTTATMTLEELRSELTEQQR